MPQTGLMGVKFQLQPLAGRCRNITRHEDAHSKVALRSVE